MSYSGGITEAARTAPSLPELYVFLRRALLEVPISAPYRGPEQFIADGFVYQNQANGSLENFTGHEKILREGQVLYTLQYGGGIIR